MVLSLKNNLIIKFQVMHCLLVFNTYNYYNNYNLNPVAMMNSAVSTHGILPNQNLPLQTLEGNQNLPLHNLGENQNLPLQNNEENPSEVDIVIENVVCSFNLRCHLDLRKIALWV